MSRARQPPTARADLRRSATLVADRATLQLQLQQAMPMDWAIAVYLQPLCAHVLTVSREPDDSDEPPAHHPGSDGPQAHIASPRPLGVRSASAEGVP